MANILIAVQTQSLCTALADALPQHELHCCYTGADALASLEALRPDALLIDLSLPEITGLSVLQRTTYRPPVRLALTSLCNDLVLQAAEAAGVQELFLLPCSVRSVLRHLEERLETPTPTV